MKNNRSAVDTWTAGHLAVGMALGKMRVTKLFALGFAVLWEVAEQPFTNESLPNVVVDAAATYIGYTIGGKL